MEVKEPIALKGVFFVCYHCETAFGVNCETYRIAFTIGLGYN